MLDKSLEFYYHQLFEPRRGRKYESLHSYPTLARLRLKGSIPLSVTPPNPQNGQTN